MRVRVGKKKNWWNLNRLGVERESKYSSELVLGGVRRC